MNIHEKIARCESADEVARMLDGTGHVIVKADSDWAFMAQVVGLPPERKRLFMQSARLLMRSE